MPLPNRKIVYKWAFIVFSMALLYACASPSGSQPAGIQSNSQIGFIHEYEDFVIVKTIQGDSLEALAARFLGDSAKAWLIAEFNDIDTLLPGKEIIIPLIPIHPGGLKGDGFQKVPILLYHDFSRTRSSKMKVLESSFEAQMKYLKENDYHVISLDRFLNFIEYQEELPQKSVVITIDDGWKSLYTIAYPILKKYNFPATLFVYTDFIGGKKALTWSQIKELAEYGFDIQCHTKTHRYLTRIKDGETFDRFFKAIDEELTYPKKLLQRKINRDCNCLAYPYGKTSSLVAAMLKKHGYRAAFTVTRGGNPFFLHNYKINRSAIYGQYDLEKFKKNLDVFQPITTE